MVWVSDEGLGLEPAHPTSYLPSTMETSMMLPGQSLSETDLPHRMIVE